MNYKSFVFALALLLASTSCVYAQKRGKDVFKAVESVVTGKVPAGAAAKTGGVPKVPPVPGVKVPVLGGKSAAKAPAAMPASKGVTRSPSVNTASLGAVTPQGAASVLPEEADMADAAVVSANEEEVSESMAKLLELQRACEEAKQRRESLPYDKEAANDPQTGEAYSKAFFQVYKEAWKDYNDAVKRFTDELQVLFNEGYAGDTNPDYKVFFGPQGIYVNRYDEVAIVAQVKRPITIMARSGEDVVSLKPGDYVSFSSRGFGPIVKVAFDAMYKPFRY